MNRLASLLPLTALLATVVGAACLPQDSARNHVRAVQESVFVSTLSWELLRVSTPDGGIWVMAPDAGAEFARSHEALMVLDAEPAGCASATGSGDTVGASFSSCSRPLTTVQFSGTAQVALDMARADESIQSSGSLTGSIDHQGLGRLTLDAAANFYGAHGASTGFVRSTGVDIEVTQWSRGCLHLKGSLPSGEYTVVTCRGACPTGTAQASAAGASVEVVFDGTPTATWQSAPPGPVGSGTIALFCTP